jgi:hypothetical protein
MKIDNISFRCSGDTEHAVFSFRDPTSLNPYIAKAVVGLDAEEIVPRFYGVGQTSNIRFYAQTVERRNVILRLALNPDVAQGHSFSSLRDNLYRTIASTRTGRVELQFRQGLNVIAALKGFIVKLEVPNRPRLK